MGEKEKCQYKNHSKHVVDVLGKKFVCDRDAVLDGYCEFHHPSYWKENGEELRRKFYEIVEDAIKNSKPLIAIGYHLPEINLREKIFKIPVLFIDAKSYGRIHFVGAEFHKSRADFRGAEFHEESIAFFMGAEFHKSRADFSNSEFHKSRAEFVGAKFHEESRADFRGAEFHEESIADFSNSEFHKSIANFENVKFNEVIFINNMFVVPINECASDELYKMIIKRKDVDKKEEMLYFISFQDAVFPEAPHKVIFDHTYLGRVSFLGANIERVGFGNVVWSEVGGRYMVFDEALLRLKADEKLRKKLLSKLDEDKRKDYEQKINSPNVTIVNIANVYNMLRENYEYFLRYDEAGKFFISEMEVKRLIREVKTKSSKGKAEAREVYGFNSWFRRNLSILGLYKHIALYGETAHRQLFIITPLLIAFFWGLRMITGTCSVEPCNHIEQLVDSIAAYMQFPRAATIIDTIERLISIPILSTIFIALRRKLERRYRH